ncbi:MAG: hypothetical protein A2X13_05040 [Bacteroidetes bacterium GWC2_33_15]|nr:MAG: hypothetical protein A2X10_12910 [Bacteroidetes bacterium GWA2_33_15]OFX50957.1 MAG: hypothetical protein A2X13_05040 [Bacteroidetes bacterium GWC2_33_15]OFX66537.1 MAG: hypothetical protein A2X15_15320 [Bacteroidetes bacterium GWB2_32_14]OFX70183.1 MAG: hypothetical protein A2X14_12800 [Bacteroidetes bacterium GWD2_33_33]HAN20003.1 hypothetical protein [Bacteroidales bacterium]
MIQKIITYILLIVLTLVFTKFSYSQEEQLAKEVQVVKPYEPTISDAFKINRLPRITDTLKLVPKVKYSLQTKQLNLGYSIEPIKPAKMVGEPLVELYNSYVTVGIGTKVLPVIEAYVNNLRSKEYSYGAYYKHMSSFAKITLDDDIRQDAGFHDNDLRFFGKKFIKNTIIFADMGLKSNTMYHYGYDTSVDTILLKDNIKQNFLLLDLNANYKTNYIDSTHVNYDFGFSLDYLKDNFENHELAFKINGDINKIFTSEMIGVNFSIEHYSVNETIDSSNNTVVKINPWVGKFGEKFRVKAGLNIFSDNRGDFSNTYYFPTGSLEYNIVNNIIIPYAGVDGKLEINNYQSTTTINPFITPGLGLKNTDYKIILFAGLKGNFSSSIFYNFKATYSLIDNMPFFVNNLEQTDSIGNQFNVVYDNIQLISYFGELSVAASEKLNFHIMANYRDYKMDKEEKAWHKPTFDLTFAARYNIKNKIIVKADLFAIGKRYAKIDDTGNFNELESVIDINIGAEYRYSKILSGFIQINNLLSEKYYTWNYYPAYGLNILLGITYSF